MQIFLLISYFLSQLLEVHAEFLLDLSRVGLCPELRQVFSLTMTTGPLPFPSKLRPEVEDKVIPTPSKDEEKESEQDVEVTRFGEKQVRRHLPFS